MTAGSASCAAAQTPASIFDAIRWDAKKSHARAEVRTRYSGGPCCLAQPISSRIADSTASLGRAPSKERAGGPTIAAQASGIATRGRCERSFVTTTTPHGHMPASRWHFSISIDRGPVGVDSQRPRTHARGQRAPAIASGSTSGLVDAQSVPQSTASPGPRTSRPGSNRRSSTRDRTAPLPAPPARLILSEPDSAFAEALSGTPRRSGERVKGAA